MLFSIASLSKQAARSRPKCNPNATKVVWIDRLAVSTAFRLAVYCRRENIDQAFYLKATALGLLGVRLAKWLQIGPRDLRTASYSLGDLCDEAGRSLRYRVDEDNLRLVEMVAKELFEVVEGHQGLCTHLPREKVFLYFCQSLAKKTHPFVLLAYLGLAHQKSDGPESPAILVEDRWVAKLLGKLHLDVACLEVPLPSFLESVIEGGNRWWLAIGILALVMANGFRPIFPSKRTHVQLGVPKILVEFCDGTGAADSRFRTDLFWFSASQLRAESLLIYFDRGVCAPSADIKAEFDRLGLDWVSLPGLNPRKILHAAMGCRSWPYRLSPGAKQLWSRIRHTWSLCVRSDAFRFWWALHDLRFIGSVEWWTEFFKRHGTIAHIHVHDTDWWMISQSIAMDLAGGIGVGRQWSHYLVPHPQAITVYFAWGPYYDTYLKRTPSQIGRLLYAGHLSGQACPPPSTRARDLRLSFERQGAKYVIALFDSSFNPTCHYSRGMHLALYRAILDKIERDRSLGVIIKPKNEDNLDQLPEIRKLIEMLSREGRCRVIDYRVVPSEVVLAADILVGLGPNGAVLEGVLAGRPGLHCDLSRKYDDPLYQQGYGRVIFDDLDRFLEALDAHRAGNRSELGDHRFVLPLIDPFQDGEGAKRVGMYLGWYYRVWTQGYGREEALAYATAQYEAHWGQGKNGVPAGAIVPAEGWKQPC